MRRKMEGERFMKKIWMLCLTLLIVVAVGGVFVMAFGNGNQGQTDTGPVAQPELPYQKEVVAQHLDVPWAIDRASDGRLFFTERPGNVRVIQEGKLLEQPVISFPEPFVQQGEGGLLGLVLDPDFANNHYLYVYHTYREGESIFNRVLRLKEENNQATIDKVLIDRIPGGVIHNGGRLKVGPDQKLYITTGDAGEPDLAQDQANLAGKILRLNLDGTIPADNPTSGSPVYSWGHRNPQGLAWSPDQKSLYSSEHGQSAHDELNRIEPGANYGWPKIQGDEVADSLKKPVLHSGKRTWAPSGMTFVTQGPWKGQLLIANLRGQQLLQIQLNAQQPDEVTQTINLFRDEYGRIRDVLEAADGSIYVLTNNRDGRGKTGPTDDQIIRLVPQSPK
jgi:glucose/arabinose dehydrogenase